jgi:hypothetical protein
MANTATAASSGTSPSATSSGGRGAPVWIAVAVLGAAAAAWLFWPAGDPLAARLAGTWEATLPGGVVEQLTLEKLQSNEEGGVHDRKTSGGAVIEEFDGRWHIRTNPLLPEQARTQLEIGWVDRVIGRKDLAVAIREVSAETLTICSVYLDAQCTSFQRLR